MKKHIVLILLVLILSVFASSQNSKAIEDKKTKIKIELGVQVGVITDTRVRLRSEPNLQSETLDHLDTGDRLIILDKSAEQQQIDTMTDYWYKVQAEGYPEGWVYGAFVDYEIVWEDPASEEYAKNILDKADGIIMKSDLAGSTEFKYVTILNKEVAISNEKNPINVDILKKAFSYDGIVDLMTGKHPEDFVSLEYLNSIESVKKLTIVENTVKRYILTYKNGMVLTDSYYTRGSDTRALEYDDKGKLIKAGRATFTYPQELQTDQVIERLYYAEEWHQIKSISSTERYRLIEDGFEAYSSRVVNSRASYGISRKYIYKDGLLIEIKEKEIQYQRPIELGYEEELMETTYTISYENDLIKEITYEDKENTYGWVQTFTYEGKNIIKSDKQFYDTEREKNNNLLEMWIFSNYDEYGNWLSCEYYKGGEVSSTIDLSSKIEREIEYY